MSDPFQPPSAPNVSDLYASPEATALEAAKAARGARLFAYLIDTALPVIALFVLALPIGMLEAWTDARQDTLTLGLYGIYIGYSVFNWALIVARGQTVGKMMMGVRIVSEDGSPVDFVRGVVLRSWLMGLLNSMFCVTMLIDGALIFNDDRRCLHDRIAKTIVVDALAYNPYR